MGKCIAGSYVDYNYSVSEGSIGEICTFRFFKSPMSFSGLLICLTQRNLIIGF